MDLVGMRGDGRCVNNANPVRQQVDQTPGWMADNEEEAWR